ncbi:MAG: addiction module protein [Candidatus Margulisiibacteriota bacterium]
MTDNTKKLIEIAIKLKPFERLFIVDMLVKSLNVPDPDIDKIWLKEAEKRLDAVLSGKMEMVDWK